VKRVVRGLGVAALVGVLMLFASATVALASEGYGRDAVEGNSVGGGALPFTGLSLALYGGVAVAVVFSAVLLRGYTERRRD
jgi:hypothetical protein